MVYYRSIEVNRSEITEPRLITEYSYFIQEKEAVTQTFTVVNPGLYFILATGVAVGTSETYPFTFSINSANAPIYIQYFGNNRGRYAFIQLDAGDTITYTADASSRTDFAKRQAFLAARITNATFVSRYSTKSSNPLTYTPPSDGNMHLTIAIGSSIRWWQDVTDTTIIPEECNALKVGSAEQDLVVYAIGSVNDAVYVNLAGDMYGGTLNITDFLLTPTNSGEEVTFNETVIANNSNVEDIDITFTDDWANYDLLKIEFASYADSTTEPIIFYTTPRHIDTIAELEGKLRISLTTGGRIYSVDKSTLTWSKFAGGENWCVKKVSGLTCNNYVFTETQIFKGVTAGSNNSVEITTQESLFDYDLIFITLNDGNYTRCTPSMNIITPINRGDFSSFVSYYIRSSNDTVLVQMLKHKLSSARYLYVSGVKFR